MPPRHAYWTIVVDDQPTSFRAHDLEELLPTFNRLREKHPSAQMKWFERGQLWESRDAAREQGFGRGERRWEGPRPDRDERGESRPRDARESGERTEPPRDRKWRPGGEHRDPRQKYRDANKAKWDRYKQNIRARWEEKRGAGGGDRPLEPPTPDRGDRTPPHGDPMRGKVARPDRGPAWRQDDRRPQGRGDFRSQDRGERRDRSERREDQRGGWRGEQRGRERDDRREQPREFRRGDERKEWRPKGPRKPWGSKPGGGATKPWGAAKAGGPAKRSWGGPKAGGAAKKSWDGPKGGGAKKPWAGKPAGGGGGRKPWGAKSAGGGFRNKPAGGGFRDRSRPPRGPRGAKKPRRDEE